MSPWAFALILGLAAGPAARAHHSLSGYDRSRQAGLDAVVVEFRFVNPHAFLVVAAGGEIWRLEMDNRNELADTGFTQATFRSGDRVRIVGDPDRNGARALYLRRLERPADGLLYEQVGSSPRLTRTVP